MKRENPGVRVVLASLLHADGEMPPVIRRALENALPVRSGCYLRIAEAILKASPDGKIPGFISIRKFLADDDLDCLTGLLNGNDHLPLLAAAYEAERLLEKKPAESSEINSADALPPILDAAEILEKEITLPGELVAGILHQGNKMVLGGGSKTFKTWTLLDLSVAVATGEPWLSCKTTQGRVLFLNFEIQSGFFRQRIKAVQDAKGVTLTKGQIDVWNLRGRATDYQTLLPRVSERVKNSGYVLIVIDPIYKLYGSTDENSAGEVARLLNAIESLAVDSGAAVAFAAHYAKGNAAGKEAIDRISGSGVFARDPDSILNFTRHEENEAFAVEATLRNFKPIEPFVVRWQYPIMRRDESLDPAKLKQAKGRPKKYSVTAIVDCLKGEELTTKQWLERAGSEIGIPKTQFYELLKKAKEMPQVKKTSQGQWFYDQTKEQKSES